MASKICIVINEKSQGSIARHLSLRCDEVLYYTFIIQSAGERIFLNWWTFGKVTGKMGFMRSNRLAFLFSKTLMSPDKMNNVCITDRTATIRCYVNRQISMSLLSTNIKLLLTSFDLNLLTARLTPSVTEQLPIMHGILLRQLLYSGSWDFFYMTDVNNFLLVN